MPRTSYGEKKRNQAWQIVAALMERQGTQGVQFCENVGGQISLMVEASLQNMKDWSELTIEEVRESLTQHLGKSFLGIMIDKRTQMAGHGAETWKFELSLWSTDQVENQQQFYRAWQETKSRTSKETSNSHISSDHPLNSPQPGKDIEALVQQVREYCCQKILNQNSRMRLLSGEEIEVDQLYVDVWLLNRSPRTFQVSQPKLLETFDLRNDRLGLGERIQRRPGLEVATAEAKLLVLGKPGSGKTTFLKHLAVDWCKGRFRPDLTAVFIEFRLIREDHWNLVDEIYKELGLENWKLEKSKQIKDRQEQIEVAEKKERAASSTKESEDCPEQIKLLKEQVKKLQENLEAPLRQVNFLVLMDGFDEIPTSRLRLKVQDQLRQFVADYPNNRFVLTCRTQIIESIPVGFTSVEIADFSAEQVKQFVQNWFKTSGKLSTEIAHYWEAFECKVFNNPSLKELTVTPVLLSLMCLVLQDEGEIPSQVTWLYRKGIKLLLCKWNDAKKIDGWEVGNETYQKLNVEQKEELLIEVAARKFENPENFLLFEQEEIVTLITKFLQLTNRSEGEAVLKAIEAQHGLLIERADELWSFSHLTFQEYFTARWLTQLPSEQLAKKIMNYRWQEIIKQLVKSQQLTDRLLRLIKQAVDRSIANEPKLNEFLTWLLQKSESIRTNYKPAVIRAFYFELTCARTLDCTLALLLDLDPALAYAFALTFNLDFEFPGLNPNLDPALDLDIALDRILNRDYTHVALFDRPRLLEQDCTYAHALARGGDHELAEKLQQFKATLPTLSRENWNSLQQEWQINLTQWLEQLRQVMIEHCNIGHNWQFTDAQKQQLQSYYEVNKFLVDLINIDGAFSNPVRTEIEDTLLLPWEELQHRHPEIYM